MRLTKVTVPGTYSSDSYHYWATLDGRFEITQDWRGDWQAVAKDGTKPFRHKLFGKVRYSAYFNADTLGECRMAIEWALEEEPTDG